MNRVKPWTDFKPTMTSNELTGDDRCVRWLAEAREQKAKYILMCCDRFQYEYYPVFVGPEDDLAAAVHEHHKAKSWMDIQDSVDDICLVIYPGEQR